MLVDLRSPVLGSVWQNCRGEGAVGNARPGRLQLPKDAANDKFEGHPSAVRSDDEAALAVKVIHSNCSVVRFATANGARPADLCNESGGASTSNSRLSFKLPLSSEAGADKRVELTPVRPATPFQDDVRGSFQSPLSARLGAGRSSGPAGAAPSASAMPRSMVGEGGGWFPLGLTASRLRQVTGQLGGDRAPAIRLLQPSASPIRLGFGVVPIAARERCGGDHRFCECGHHQPLSTGNICGGASQVIWQVSEDFQ